MNDVSVFKLCLDTMLVCCAVALVAATATGLYALARAIYRGDI